MGQFKEEQPIYRLNRLPTARCQGSSAMYSGRKQAGDTRTRRSGAERECGGGGATGTYGRVRQQVTASRGVHGSPHEGTKTLSRNNRGAVGDERRDRDRLYSPEAEMRCVEGGSMEMRVV